MVKINNRMIQSTISPYWLIATDDDTHTPEDSAYVMNDLLAEFASMVPVDLNRRMIISNDNNRQFPITLFNHEAIVLATKGSAYYCQNVYQLSHELIHFAVEGNTPATWFEETMCELSSHIFLRRLKNCWSLDSDRRKKAYANHFLEYSKNELKKRRHVRTTDLSNKGSDLNEYLKKQNEDREVNRYIAYRLLHLASTQKGFWSFVPYLRDIPYDNGLNEYLSIVKSRADSHSIQTLNLIASQLL